MQFPLVAGISGQSTNESIKLAADAALAGADYGLLLPPSYWPKAISNGAIEEFYRDVADNSKIPIIVYNVSTNPFYVGHLADNIDSFRE